MNRSQSDLLFDRLKIGSCVIDPSSLSIQSERGNSLVEPKVMLLMQVLAERPHETMVRDELLDRIWPGGDGSDESLTRLIYMLRKAFAHDHDVRGIIRTVSKQGYRLDLDVMREPQSVPSNSMKPSLADRPSSYSLAVLPFAELESRFDTTMLRAGLTHDVTTLLSRSKGMRVAPASSTSYFIKHDVPFSQMAPALSVRYLLHASLQRDEATISIAVELFDSEEQALAWSDRITVPISEYSALGDEIALRIATAISTTIKIPVGSSTRSRSGVSLDAFEKVHLSRSLRVNYGPETAKKIEDLLTDALRMSPDDALIKTELAVQLSQSVVSKWVEDEGATRTLANDYIREALNDRPADPDVLAGAGVVSTMFHDPESAIGYLKRALEIDPSNAHALAVLGWQKCLKQSDPSGLADIINAEQRAPHHPRFGLWATYKCTAYLFMLDYTAGESACRDAIVRTPNYYQPHCSLAWALTGLGKFDQAKVAIKNARNFGDENIIGRFVEEMYAWTSNSPNHLQSKKILDQLLEISAAT